MTELVLDEYNVDYLNINLEEFEQMHRYDVIDNEDHQTSDYSKNLNRKLEIKLGKSFSEKKILYYHKNGNGFANALKGTTPNRIVFSVIADRSDYENPMDFMNTTLDILIKNKYVLIIRRKIKVTRTTLKAQFFIIIENYPIINTRFIIFKKFFEQLLTESLKMDQEQMLDVIYENEEKESHISGKFYLSEQDDDGSNDNNHINRVLQLIAAKFSKISSDNDNIQYVKLDLDMLGTRQDNKQIYFFHFTFSITEPSKISKKEIADAKKKIEEQNKGESSRAKANVAKQNKRTKNIQCHNDVEFILQENIEDFDPTELTQLTLNKKIYCFENSSFVNMIKYAKDQKVRGDCKPPVDGKPLECKWFYPINIGFNVFIDSDNYDNLLKNNDKRFFEFKNKRIIDFTTGLHIMSEKSGKDNVYDIVTVSQKGGKVLNRRKKYIVIMKKNKKKPVKKVTKKPVKKVTKKPVKKVTKKPVKKVIKKLVKK